MGVVGNIVNDLHPDKTFIGRIDKGFDFLGYHFKTIKAEANFVTSAFAVGKTTRQRQSCLLIASPRKTQ